jgi:hypothetical protein
MGVGMRYVWTLHTADHFVEYFHYDTPVIASITFESSRVEIPFICIYPHISFHRVERRFLPVPFILIYTPVESS